MVVNRCSLCNHITGVFYYVVKFNDITVKYGVICSSCKATLRLDKDKMLVQNNGVIIQ